MKRDDITITPAQLKKFRGWLEMTQEELAGALGYNSGRYIRALENGENPITARMSRAVLNMIETKKGNP